MTETPSDAEILRILKLDGAASSGEPIHVLDLPQLYQKPATEVLHAVLTLLDLPPSTFNDKGQTSKSTIIHPEGITAYLTKIISSSLAWLPSDTDREMIWDQASQRLSQRSGRTAMADITRRFTIPTRSDETNDISLEIYEPALTEDNLGLKTWSSSYVLAKKVHLLQSHVPLSKDTPVLELGAGTGLVGLAAAAVWRAHVVLTDLPAIVPNLARNVDQNAEVIKGRGGAAVAGTLDWLEPETLVLSDTTQELASSGHLQPGKVQTILAADPIYSPDHPRMLVNTVSVWLEQTKDTRLVLAYPIREAYLPQIVDLRTRLQDVGLKVVVEGTEMTRDDWAEEVEVRWSVWGREKGCDA